MITPQAKAEPLLSIVVIARNEAAHIARAIQATMRATRTFPGAEIVLVDSASTDATVEIARGYPIDIVRLRAEWYLSAAAGRYIGFHQTRGKFILYLDGDMALCPGWLEQAIPYLLAHPQTAGCCGYWKNISATGKIEMHKFNANQQIQNVGEFGGAALYRRTALKQVGNFNPYIRSSEEPELCARLRHAGFELACLPHQIVEHYGLPEHSLANYWRRWKNGMWSGYGQVLRYHWGKPTFDDVVYTHGIFNLLLTTLAAAGGLCLVLCALVLHNPLPIYFLIGGGALGILAMAWRKKSLSQALLSLTLRGIILLSSIQGFLMPPRQPADYPMDAEIIQTMTRK